MGPPMSSFSPNARPFDGADEKPATVFQRLPLWTFLLVWFALMATALWNGALVWLAAFLIWTFVI
jgi:hypothetical protein